MPAVGFGAGDVTLRDFLETHGLMPAYRASTDLFLAVLDRDTSLYADGVAAELRRAGVSVAVDYTNRSVGDRIKKALRDNIPYFMVVGENEAKTQRASMKNLSTQAQTEHELHAIGIAALARDIKNSANKT